MNITDITEERHTSNLLLSVTDEQLELEIYTATCIDLVQFNP